MHAQLVMAAEDLVEPVAPGWQLVTAALVAIALIVVLITVAKLSPFLALILGGLTVGIIAGENILDVLESFSTGFGDSRITARTMPRTIAAAIDRIVS